MVGVATTSTNDNKSFLVAYTTTANNSKQQQASCWFARIVGILFFVFISKMSLWMTSGKKEPKALLDDPEKCPLSEFFDSWRETGMRGVIMQNIFLNIQGNDILATPVSFSCTMSSFNDVDCMKTLLTWSSSENDFFGSHWYFLSPHFCLLWPLRKTYFQRRIFCLLWGDNLHQG